MSETPKESEPSSSSAANAMPSWKRRFVVSAGIAAGITLVLSLVILVAVWYTSRPVKARPWDQTAITAEYAGLSVRTGQPFVCMHQYTVENHSGYDYELPSSVNLYKVLAEGKGLERDATLKWSGGTSLPVGQKMNVTIEIEYEYTEEFPYAERDNTKKLAAFMNRALSGIDGFVALDEINRYEIRFPKPPTDTKP
jgi:hypothetical protein